MDMKELWIGMEKAVRKLGPEHVDQRGGRLSYDDGSHCIFGQAILEQMGQDPIRYCWMDRHPTFDHPRTAWVIAQNNAQRPWGEILAGFESPDEMAAPEPKLNVEVAAEEMVAV
jgi:hypothetical protein